MAIKRSVTAALACGHCQTSLPWQLRFCCPIQWFPSNRQSSYRKSAPAQGEAGGALPLSHKHYSCLHLNLQLLALSLSLTLINTVLLHKYLTKQAKPNNFLNVKKLWAFPSPVAHLENTRNWFCCRKQGDSGCLSMYQNFLSCSHICNPNTWKAETGGLPQVWEQSELQRRPCHTKKENFSTTKTPIFLPGEGKGWVLWVKVVISGPFPMIGSEVLVQGATL